MNTEPKTMRLVAEATKLEVKSAEANAKATEARTEATEAQSHDLNKKVYTVVNPFRSIHNFDKEHFTGDEFTETKDKERLLDLLTKGFIK